MALHRGLVLVLAGMACAQACAASPGSLIREGAGSVSQTLCSKVFVSGLDPDAVFAAHLRPEPGMGLIAWALRYDVDREKRQVVTHVGGVTRRAHYTEGRGCTLDYDGLPEPSAIQLKEHETPSLAEIAGDRVVAPQDPRLVAALDAAFVEPAKGARRNTQAVVVVHDGKVIAERYAPGVGPDTPLLSHSMAKSVISSLAGILAREGKLALDEPLGAPEWQKPGDPRAALTVDELLRMTTGMGFDEGHGSSIATQIWYNEADTAAASAHSVNLASAPGTRWGYSSRSYVLLSRLIEQRTGGTPQSIYDFAQHELFDPLGMRTLTMEFDSAGTPMGANAMLASARDWAKLGLLYLNDGVVGDRRILPEGWVKRVTTPSVGSGYGAGFWLNTTDAAIPEWGMRWGMPGAPADAYFARGYMGQYTVIVPSARLVIVRMGQAHTPGMEVATVGRLVRDVIAALP